MITVLLLSEFRGSKKGNNTAFRESFGQPGQLRSFCKQGNRFVQMSVAHFSIFTRLF